MDTDILHASESRRRTAERNPSLDLLRGVAIILVVIGHSVTRNAQPGLQVRITQWLVSFTKPAIAVFLFVAGYLFRTQGLDVRYLQRKYKRVIIPYLVFSGLALLYQHGLGLLSFVANNPLALARIILDGGAWAIYYFVPLILFIYTLAFVALRQPLLKRNLASLTLMFLMLNLLQAAYYNPLMEKLGFAGSDFAGGAYYRSPFYWPFFFFLGIAYKKWHVSPIVQGNKGAVRALWLLAFAAYNVLLAMDIGPVNGLNSIIGTIYSVATIFVLLTLNIRQALVTFLSRTSYFIYLSHIFIVYAIVDAGARMGVAWPYWMSMVSLVASLAVPVLAYLLIKRVLQEKSIVLLGA